MRLMSTSRVGRASRIAGWDPTGRYLLLESTHSSWLSAFTGSSTTNHWVFDVVTSQFVPRKGFTGMRDGKRFRWKQDGTYHGVWQAEPEGAVVVPLEPGELAEVFQEHEVELREETKRRTEHAEQIAVGSGSGQLKELSIALGRLDDAFLASRLAALAKTGHDGGPCQRRPIAATISFQAGNAAPANAMST